MTDNSIHQQLRLWPARWCVMAIMALVASLAAMRVAALPLDHYASRSALAEGRWVKISVDQTGLHAISAVALRQWGFTDPSRVRIYGYGGRRIADVLNAANYIDDLPEVPCELTDAGLVFYAHGPGEWVASAGLRYHWETNIYTTAGYYFLTEATDDAPAAAPTEAGRAGATQPSTQFFEHRHHEQELVSPGEAGPLLVGEDFRYTPRRTFTFDMPGRLPDTKVWSECSFVAKTHVASSWITISYNGTELSSTTSDRIPTVQTQQYYHGAEAMTRHDVVVDGDATTLDVGITHNSTSAVLGAWLNYLTISYVRSLTMPAEGVLHFRLNTSGGRLASAKADTRIWDVTDARRVMVMRTEMADGNAMLWTNDYTGTRSYVAWTPGAKLPQPSYVGTVANQDLHADGPVDMVIFTLGSLRQQAERIARMHAESSTPLTVRVIDVEHVYNEFASGSPDVSALRKYLKMIYDRGSAEGTPLRYCLLLGRMTYDNRHLTAPFKALGINTIPAWYVPAVRSSLTDNDGFGTDDFIAMLDDGSGFDMGLDDLSIAVGRIPAVSPSDASAIVDKLILYLSGARRSAWKHRMLFLADDQDAAVHMKQTEKLIEGIEATEGCQHLLQRVYMDAYRMTNGEYPQARSDMFRLLNEGVVWWNFVGHANNHAWTHDGQLTFNDINNMYLRNVPFIYAATCDFLRWDSNTLSGGEIMYKEKYGGAIGMISATRPVYITDNGLFSAAMGRALVRRDADGMLPTVGEIYRRAKNNILTSTGAHRSNGNRLRYVLMGDPAMPLATPSNVVSVTSVAGVDITGDDHDDAVLAALQLTTIEGVVTDPRGEVLTGFNGTVNVEIYDAEHSITTLANGENGEEYTFDTHGDKLFAGAATVTAGHFVLPVAMPSETANNYRRATMSLYATTADAQPTEAVGLCRDFYVYGFDETTPPDTEAPVISSLMLNHDGFRPGDCVDPSPMLIAQVSDNIGINISTAGIGHQMVLILDGNRSFTDVANYFTPAGDGSPSGVINYPFESLMPGNHTALLRVWDTSGNAAEQSIDFSVVEGLAPVIFSVHTDVNPATTHANFYVTHDRPDRMMTVTVSVYDLAGRQMWSAMTTALSDMTTTLPVTWDLTDTAGRRVPRGIYVYRASITDDGNTFQTASQRLAVTAQ